MTKFRRGQIVEVHFLDHVENGDHPYEFVVFGRVAAVDRRSITVECWAYVDEAEKDKTNVTRYVICRTTITRWWQLTRTS